MKLSDREIVNYLLEIIEYDLILHIRSRRGRNGFDGNAYWDQEACRVSVNSIKGRKL